MADLVRNLAQAESPHLPNTKLTSPDHIRNLVGRVLTNSLLSQELPLKPRKSVTFSEDNTIMDENGEISEAAPADESKTTAVKHSTRMSSDAKVMQTSSLITCPAPDAAVDEVTEMFAGMGKKKKKSSKPKTTDETAVDGAEPAVEVGDFDLTKKKKKKAKPKVAETGDSFEAKLAEAGVEESTEPRPAKTDGDTKTPQTGDPELGTGIWAHNSTTPISYELLLSRFFTLLNHYNPDILSSGSRSYKVPPPQCLREGNKKTIFANIAEICKRMNRNDEHVTQFLFAELGTSGSVDGSKRLVIKGRFQQKQIENVLRRYIGMSPLIFPIRNKHPQQTDISLIS